MDDEPRMDDEPLPALDRCAAHNLTVGPDGECVLCRRARTGPPPRAPWMVPGIAAAGLGVLLLGGVALARARTPPPPPPVVDARPVEAPASDPADTPGEAPPVLPDLAELSPPAPPAPPPSAKPEPQRNYLDEAYAAMDKRGLYDDPHPKAAATARPTCRMVGGQRVYYRGGSYAGAAGQPNVTLAPAPAQAPASSRFTKH